MNKGNLVFCNREEAVSRMNLWGSERRSFFFLIDFDGEKCLVEETSKLSSEDLLFVFPDVANVKDKVTPFPDLFDWQAFPQSFEEYSRSFDIVYRNLYGGNSFLTNLTCATPVRTNLTLRQVFDHARAKYKLWVKDSFTVFSPETFVRIKDGFIYSYPMKGTIDATLPHAREKLLGDEKETAEHATITDLIRNDLSQVATEVTVTRYRYLEKLITHRSTLLQMSSEIRGRLPEDYRGRLGELFFCMLPAGSITGAPKKKTVEIIREAETYHRGFYTGVMGYFDGDNLDSAVLIRFLEQTEQGMVYKSGGGITFKSDVRSEYEEMKQKVYVPIY
jgi:para-aminobenzoate synthetase component 1